MVGPKIYFPHFLIGQTDVLPQTGQVNIMLVITLLRNVSIIFYCYTDMKHFDQCTNGIIRAPLLYEETFYYLFSISWYQEFDFLITRNTFPDIKKCILIPRNAFLDIKNSISWYQEIIHIFDIKKRIPDINKSILDIKESNSWYQEILLNK